MALARALILNPAVLLLDEPLGALDAKLRKALQIELKALQEEIGITFIYVTHDQEEALTMSDRLAVMSNGRVEQIGSPSDVYEEPTTAYVADFLGVSNLMDATAGGADAGGRGRWLGEFELVAGHGDTTHMRGGDRWPGSGNSVDPGRPAPSHVSPSTAQEGMTLTCDLVALCIAANDPPRVARLGAGFLERETTQ